MGCFSKMRANEFNFFYGRTANDVLISELAVPHTYCPLFLEAPTDLGLSNPTVDGFDFEFTSNSLGGETGFTIQFSLTSDFAVIAETVNNDPGETTGSVTGLDDSSLYYARVRANGSPNSDWSATATGNTLQVILFNTVWNDATANDGAFQLVVNITGAGNITYSVEGGGEYIVANNVGFSTNTLNIPADTGDLDGTERTITIVSNVLYNITGINWIGKKPSGVINFRGLAGASLAEFSVNTLSGSSAMTQVVIPDMELDGTMNFNRNSIAGVLDLSDLLFTSNAGTAIGLKLFGSPITDIVFRSGSEMVGSAAITYSVDLRSTSIVDLDFSPILNMKHHTIDCLGLTSLLSVTPPSVSWIARILEFGSCSNLASIDLSNFQFDAGQAGFLRLDGCSLGYMDISNVFPNWDAVAISIELQNNSMTATEVNHYLVDLDGAITSTSGAINIAGTNAAPDTTSGGYNGSAAKTSLISKGLTVTTN